MYRLSVRNAANNTLLLSQNETKYKIKEITGLSEPSANINVTTIAGVPGGKFNSAQIQTRNIVITVRICGDVETNRDNLYTFFPTGESVRLFYNPRTGKATYIDCYVDKMDCNPFSNSVTAQISLIALYPYFRSNTPQIKTMTDSPWTFTTTSSVDVGATFSISVLSAVSYIEIIDNSTRAVSGQNAFKIVYSFLSGDFVVINTKSGEKTITLTRNNTTTNLISALDMSEAYFPQIHAGANSFTVNTNAGSSAVSVSVGYSDAYSGV